MSHDAIGKMIQRALRFVRVQRKRNKLVWMGDGKEWPGLTVMLHHRDCSDRKPECYEEIEHGPGRWRVLKQGKHVHKETKEGLLSYLDGYTWEYFLDKMIRPAISIIKSGKLDMCLASRRSLLEFHKDPRPDEEVDADTKKDEKETPADTGDDDKVMRPQARPPMPGRNSVGSLLSRRLRPAPRWTRTPATAPCPVPLSHPRPTPPPLSTSPRRRRRPWTRATTTR
jgi:hypothetical protein